VKKLFWLLPLLSGGIVMGCLVYCRFWWTPRPMSLTDPDFSIICWLFCRTMNPFWFYLGILISSLSLLAGIMMRYKRKGAKPITLLTGILNIPTGLLNFISYYYYRSCVYQRKETASGEKTPWSIFPL